MASCIPAMDGQPLAHKIASVRRLGDRIRDHLVAQGVPETTATTDAACYCGHSLRVGFATSAAEAGCGPDEIATVTRHASLEMPRRYAKRADALRRSPFSRDGMTV